MDATGRYARAEIDSLRAMTRSAQRQGETVAELHDRMVKLVFEEAGLAMTAEAALWFTLGMLEGMMSKEGT